jgi:hypothetical protein
MKWIFVVVLGASPAFAMGTHLNCSDQNGVLAEIWGGGDGRNLWITLEREDIKKPIEGIRLIRHADLADLRTAKLETTAGETLDLIGVPLERPSLNGGRVRVTLISKGLAIQEMICE